MSKGAYTAAVPIASFCRRVIIDGSARNERLRNQDPFSSAVTPMCQAVDHCGGTIFTGAPVSLDSQHVPKKRDTCPTTSIFFPPPPTSGPLSCASEAFRTAAVAGLSTRTAAVINRAEVSKGESNFTVHFPAPPLPPCALTLALSWAGTCKLF